MQIVQHGIVEKLLTDDNIEIMEIDYIKKTCTRCMNSLTESAKRDVVNFCGMDEDAYMKLPFKKIFR